MRTLVAGHVTHDHYAEGFVAGGCAFYGAKVHDRLDGETHLVTVVGDDFTRDDEIADLDATIRRSGETTVFANYYPPDEPRIQLLEVRAPEVTPELAPPEWLDADLVHLAPVLGEIDLSAWKRAVGDGMLAINIQGWIKDAADPVEPSRLEEIQRRGVSGEARRVAQRLWEVSEEDLDGVAVACLGEEDVIDQPGLLDKLVSAVPVVAFTLGERGSRIFVDGESTEVGIYETEASDPTGAGDVFAAGFTHKLAAGVDPIEAARFAAACASVVVEETGARALTRLDEASARAERVPVFD
ncbi:MAG: PfkB family carbohydrate kinase [Persicimonas sp.]